MAFTLSTFSSPALIFFISLGIIIVAIVILSLWERNLNKKVIKNKKYEDTFFQREIDDMKIIENDSSKFLDSLNKAAREFFSSKYGLDPNLKYSELISLFKKGGNQKALHFSSMMQEALYSGETLEKTRLDFLRVMFEKLLDVSNPNKNNIKEKTVIASVPKITPAIELEKKENRKIKVSKQNEEGMNIDVVEYLREGKRRGFSEYVLKKRLIDAGFSEEGVVSAMCYLGMSSKNPIDKIVLVSEKKDIVKTSKDIKSKLVYNESRDKKYIDDPKICGLDDLNRIHKHINNKNRNFYSMS